MRQRLTTIVLVAVVSLGLAGGGVYILVVQQTGPEAEATVTECQRRGRSTTCTGTWVADGDLTDGGRVVTGTIEGANRDDLGETLDVRLSGGRAYTTSLRLPVILIAVGVIIAGLGAWTLRTPPGPRPSPQMPGPGSTATAATDITRNVP